MYKIIVFYFILLLPAGMYAQVIPAENETFNYRLIGFSFPKIKKEKKCAVEIARGAYTEDSVFGKNILKTITCSENRVVAVVPAFGERYTWRVKYEKSSGSTSYSGLYHFAVSVDSFGDTAKIRVKINKPAEKYGDAYFFADGSRTLYDMEGNPVWYLPTINNIRGKAQIRDLKLSCKNTVTFIADGEIFETDFKGRVLWQGPRVHNRKSDTLMGYHHEFTRLHNGHYMVLSFDPFPRPKPQPQPRDSLGHIIKNAQPRIPPKMRFGTIVEYDEAGEQLWNWNAGVYFDTIDLSRYKLAGGMKDRDVHENSFFFDEKNKVVYISFRDMGQVVKVSYPSGNVLGAYGRLEGPDDKMQYHPFCGEHSVKLSEDGNLFLFNNGCTLKCGSSVVILQQPQTPGDSLRKIWEFPLPDDFTPIETGEGRSAMGLPHAQEYNFFSSGGNVVPLPDSSIFVSTNTTYNRLFIVTRDKKIVWDAEGEKWSTEKKAWVPFPMYRATIVPDPKQLEDVIWNTEQPGN